MYRYAPLSSSGAALTGESQELSPCLLSPGPVATTQITPDHIFIPIIALSPISVSKIYSSSVFSCLKTLLGNVSSCEDKESEFRDSFRLVFRD